ncbi:MAG: hypothetical protein H6739_05225 [Alphaproteobacteria bacterium]|nr:hypothetical protein [Alphaproteobacteria bacterium]
MAPPGRPIPPEQRLFRERPPSAYNKPDVNPYLKRYWAAGPPVLNSEQAAGFRGAWAEAFGREAPLHVEIGTGNGFFFSGMARAHPAWNWLGVELRFKRVMMTASKVERAGAEAHARVTRYDANALSDLFAPGEVDALYINHPDPWPKDSQARNRLLSGPWLDRVAPLMGAGAELRLKTDHRVNVEALLDALEGRPFDLIGASGDVNTLGAPWPGDVRTNYQRKFAERGEPVYALRVRRR